MGHPRKAALESKQEKGKDCPYWQRILSQWVLLYTDMPTDPAQGLHYIGNSVSKYVNENNQPGTNVQLSTCYYWEMNPCS